MLGSLIALILIILTSGCVMTTKKENLRQMEMMQSIGRLGALVECQSFMLNQSIAQQQATQQPKKEEPKKEEPKK